MKKYAILFLVLLMALATASVAYADAMVPGEPYNRPHRPAPRPVEVVPLSSEENAGEPALSIRILLPDPGSYEYKLYDREAEEVVQTGSNKNQGPNACEYEALFAYPAPAEGQASRYVLTVDFSMYRLTETSFGPKRRGTPEATQIVRYIRIEGTDEGPKVRVSESDE